MTRVSPPQLSFSSGEISPLLAARADYGRYATGLARCRGFVPLPEGPVTRLPGTEYLGSTQGNQTARLVSFVFRETDAYILEFTPGALRVWRHGALIEKAGAPYVVATPWSAEQISRLQFAQSADRILIVDGFDRPRRLSRHAHDDWRLDFAPFENGPFAPQNLDQTKTIKASAASGEITLTASKAIFEAGHVGAFFSLAAVDQSDAPYWTGETDAEVGDRMRYDGNLYEIASFDGGETSGQTGVNPPTHSEGDWLSQKDGPVWRFVNSGQGVVKILSVESATSATAEVAVTLPEGVVSSASYRWSEGAWSDVRGWPSAVAYHEQRLVLAATATEPQTIWFSTIGDFSDFAPSTLADEAFSYAIAGARNRMSAISWIVSGGDALHIGATGHLFTARASGQEAMGPTSIFFRPTTAEGASSVPPVVVDGAPIFTPLDRRRLLEVSYDLASDRSMATALSASARHILEGRVSDMVWQATPWRQLWLALEDGRLASMSYHRQEEALGWALHDLAGEVESLAVIPTEDGAAEELWLTIERGGSICVERMAQPRLPGDAPAYEIPWHLFSGLAYEGPATRRLDGLEHLEGWSVHVAQMSLRRGPYLVEGGAIEVGEDEPDFEDCVVGLTALAELRLLDFMGGAQDGGSQGRMRRIKGIGVRLMESEGGSVLLQTQNHRGGRAGQSVPLVPKPKDPFETVEAFSGLVDVTPQGGWAREISITITPEPGSPLTVASVTPIMQTADG